MDNFHQGFSCAGAVMSDATNAPYILKLNLKQAALFHGCFWC